MKRNLQLEAERMPAEHYAFKPSTMAEVRTYGQVFIHVAEGQFGTCAALRGVANPHQGAKLEASARADRPQKKGEPVRTRPLIF
jgi:hypothetical protein